MEDSAKTPEMVFPCYRYHETSAPAGKRFNSYTEFEVADNGGWVDTPAKFGVPVKVGTVVPETMTATTKESVKAEQEALDAKLAEIENVAEPGPDIIPENAENGQSVEVEYDPEDVAALREEAKSLGIKGYHNMKPINLVTKIAEKNAELAKEDEE